MNLRVCDRPEWREESDVVRISVRQPLLFNYTHKSSGLHRVRFSHHAVFCCFRHSKCCLDLMSFVVSVFVLLCFCDVKSCLCHRSDFGSPALNVTAQFVINWCAVLSECFLADGKVKWRVWVKVKKEKTEQHYFPISQCEFFKVSHFLFFSFFFLKLLTRRGNGVACRPWNMCECLHRNSICKKWHSVLSYRSEIQLSSMMASVFICAESNQCEHKAVLSLTATERLPGATLSRKIWWERASVIHK